MDETLVLSGSNTIALQQVDGQYYNGFAYQNGNHTNDSCGWSCYLDTGVYTATVLYHTEAWCARTTWYFDGVQAGPEVDYYGAAPGTANLTHSFTFTNSSAGRKVLKYILKSKNTSATYWAATITKVEVVPASD